MSCLRIIAGTPAQTVRFEWPADQENDIFTRYQQFLLSVEHFATADNVQAADVEALSADDVRRLYAEGRQRSAAGGPGTST